MCLNIVCENGESMLAFCAFFLSIDKNHNCRKNMITVKAWSLQESSVLQFSWAAPPPTPLSQNPHPLPFGNARDNSVILLAAKAAARLALTKGRRILRPRKTAPGLSRGRHPADSSPQRSTSTSPQNPMMATHRGRACLQAALWSCPLCRVFWGPPPDALFYASSAVECAADYSRGSGSCREASSGSPVGPIAEPTLSSACAAGFNPAATLRVARGAPALRKPSKFYYIITPQLEVRFF